MPAAKPRQHITARRIRCGELPGLNHFQTHLQRPTLRAKANQCLTTFWRWQLEFHVVQNLTTEATRFSNWNRTAYF